jgi:hypothetical protein
MTTNEERLPNDPCGYICDLTRRGHSAYDHVDHDFVEADPLVAERRATVERIREALDGLTDVGTSYVKRSRFVVILDEEAAR